MVIDEKYPEGLKVRMTKDQKEFIEKMKESGVKSEAQAVRNCIKLYRMLTSEDLKFYEVLQAAIPKIEMDRRKEVKKLLEKGKVDEARERLKEY